MNIQLLGKNAILGALKRVEEQSNTDIKDNWPNTYPWPNYDDFVDFPDAPPPK
jgi:hypothetical protein